MAALGFAAAATLPGRGARADAELLPSPAGYVGAFLVLGPLSAAVDVEPKLGGLTARFGQPSRELPGAWQLVASGGGAVDLAKKLHAKERGARAVAFGILRLPRAFQGFLLVSVDGSFTLSVDGQELLSRPEASLRGKSWDGVRLQLEPGDHPLALLLQHPGREWAFDMRWLSESDLRPPMDARWILPGTSANSERLLASQLIQSEVTTKLDGAGFTHGVKLSFPRGALWDQLQQVRVTTRFPATPQREYHLGSLTANHHGAQTLAATLPPLGPGELPKGTHLDHIDIEVNHQRFRHERSVSARAIELAGQALEQRRLLDADPSFDPTLKSVVLATLDYYLSDVSRAANSDQRYLLAEAAFALEDLLRKLAKNRVFFLEPGIHKLAHVSDLDGRPQGFYVHVPSGFQANVSKLYPAVLALHGYNGSPKGILEAFLDTHAVEPKAGVDGFVLAPEAHGNAFYRGAGEYEAMAVLALGRALYPLDSDRISVTGVSMGGTGAAQLALRYSDTFAAAAPLCGYHSYFIRKDTRDKRLQSWEIQRMHHWSTSSWADNGRHLPLFVAHGTEDHPLENSRILIRAYQERGFKVEQEWPEIGHAVWTISYQGARLWPWLTQKTRPRAPEVVDIYTDSLRYARRFWAEIQQFQSFGSAARLHAERKGPTSFSVRTENVKRFRLLPGSSTSQQPIRLSIDGQNIELGPGAPLAFQKAKSWQARGASPAGLEKRAGLDGPIRDIFLGKVAFVYGSLKSSTYRVNREVAENFGRDQGGVSLEYPVLADRDLTSDIAHTHSLVLVGTAEDNSLLQRLEPRLPIHRTEGALWVGATEHRGPGVGATFIYPNPEVPDRYVVVITGTDILGILRALSLPRLLPDFVVYDEKLRSAATEQILGNASVRAAGYFDSHWALPK